MTTTCSANGCGRNAKVRGMCLSCYGHAWRKGTIPIKRYKARRWFVEVAPPTRPPTTQELYAMMDPAWYIPEWNRQEWARKPDKMPTKEQITAKKRVEAFVRAHPQYPKSRLSELLGFRSGVAAHEICKWGTRFPNTENAWKIHAALDAYERQHPPATP